MLANMTSGSIPRHLISYSIPLILGNLFQLTYNAVDSIIVGRFIGKEALAAVGTAAPAMDIIILGISGLCIGASVLMSGFFGAGESEKVKKELATTAVSGLLFSLAVILIGMPLTMPLVRLLSVPEKIQGMTATYLRIIFFGAPFTFLYNALASALKSVGDSRTPLRFLMLCSIVNALLDVVLIGFLGCGIVCSALTTVLAEALSAVLCIRHVARSIPLLRLKPAELRIDRTLLRDTLRLGAVTALQQSIQPIAKLLIQGAINPLGVDVMAAFNAVQKVEAYACLPEQSIANGITTFVAQNAGAGEEKRIREGFRIGILLEMGYWVLLCAAVLLFRQPIMALFVGREDRAVIDLGSGYLHSMAFFLLLPGFTNALQGYFRGRKHMKMTVLGTFIQAGLRALCVYLLTPRMGLNGVAFACAIGWCAMLMVEAPVYLIRRR